MEWRRSARYEQKYITYLIGCTLKTKVGAVDRASSKSAFFKNRFRHAPGLAKLDGLNVRRPWSLEICYLA